MTNIVPGVGLSILDRAFKKMLEERASEMANEMGLTAVQLRVLGEMSRLESLGIEEINQKDLEKALAVTHPTMTEIIKRLEKKDAVVCSISSVDKRFKRITCSKQYRDMHKELRAMDEDIFKELCIGISDDQVQMFLEIMGKMLDNIPE